MQMKFVLMHEPNSDLTALVAYHRNNTSPYKLINIITYHNTHLYPAIFQHITYSNGSRLSSQHNSTHQSSNTSFRKLSYQLNFKSSIPPQHLLLISIIIHPSIRIVHPKLTNTLNFPSRLRLIVPVFQKVDDPIDGQQSHDVFFVCIVTKSVIHYNNHLRNSTNPMQHSTTIIKDTQQQIQGRQTSLATGTSRTYTPEHWKQIWKQRNGLFAYNCKRSVNDTLTAELERYKEQVKVLKKGQNVDLRSKDNISDTCAQYVEIDLLKQTLSEHLKEKESLLRTVTLLKNDFKKEESRNIDREIAL
ncbi:hypothetical protein Tco_1361670 [Tanacetum coccineum]